MRELWRDTLERPSQVTVSLQDILRDADVTPDLFDHGQQTRIEGAADLINNRFGRGTMVVATALQSRDYLGHVRIPFGKPSDLR